MLRRDFLSSVALALVPLPFAGAGRIPPVQGMTYAERCAARLPSIQGTIGEPLRSTDAGHWVRLGANGRWVYAENVGGFCGEPGDTEVIACSQPDLSSRQDDRGRGIGSISPQLVDDRFADLLRVTGAHDSRSERL